MHSKPSDLTSSGRLSRPISQETLSKWEKCAKEVLYIVNHIVGLSRCTNEIQEKIFEKTTILQTDPSKVNSSTKVTDALNDLKI